MSVSVDDIAIGWAIRLDADAMDGAERRQLNEWLQQDDRHRGALFRAQAGLMLIETAGHESDSAYPRTRALAGIRPQWNFVSRKLMAAGAIAASIACLLILSWPMLAGEHYHTEIGEIRRIALSDGSVALVNARSDLIVRYAKATRQLRLDEGEVWFKVAKNPKRPFVVDVEDVHVRATGTAFSVRRRDDRVVVVVTEGTVQAWSDARPQDSVSISAGNTASIGIVANAPNIKVAAAGYRDMLAWRQGGVSLNETTVFEAAQEFNRYNLVQIEIANDHIGKQLMTGYFQIDRPDAFSRAVADITGARISNNGNKIVME
jgi:transmembrane sensor